MTARSRGWARTNRRAREGSDTPGDGYRSERDTSRRASQRPSQFDADGYEDHRPIIDWCLDYRDVLNEWEIPYLVSIYGFEELSDRQWAKLLIIADKVDLGRRVLRHLRTPR